MTLFSRLKSGKRNTRNARNELDRQQFNVESLEDRCSLSVVASGCVAAEVPPIPRSVDQPVAQVQRISDGGLVVIARPAIDRGTPMIGDQGVSRPSLYQMRPVTAPCTPLFGGPHPERPNFVGPHPESPVLFVPSPR